MYIEVKGGERGIHKKAMVFKFDFTIIMCTTKASLRATCKEGVQLLCSCSVCLARVAVFSIRSLGHCVAVSLYTASLCRCVTVSLCRCATVSLCRRIRFCVVVR